MRYEGEVRSSIGPPRLGQSAALIHLNGEPRPKTHSSLAASTGPLETCPKIWSWISNGRLWTGVWGGGDGERAWRRRSIAEREGRVKPSIRVVGAVYEKGPVESTWQTNICRTDKNKYIRIYSHVLKRIFCEEKAIRVIFNWHDPLRQLRYPDRSRVLWIDGI